MLLVVLLLWYARFAACDPELEQLINETIPSQIQSCFILDHPVCFILSAGQLYAIKYIELDPHLSLITCDNSTEYMPGSLIGNNENIYFLAAPEKVCQLPMAKLELIGTSHALNATVVTNPPLDYTPPKWTSVHIGLIAVAIGVIIGMIAGVSWYMLRQRFQYVALFSL